MDKLVRITVLDFGVRSRWVHKGDRRKINCEIKIILSGREAVSHAIKPNGWAEKG